MSYYIISILLGILLLVIGTIMRMVVNAKLAISYDEISTNDSKFIKIAGKGILGMGCAFIFFALLFIVVEYFSTLIIDDTILTLTSLFIFMSGLTYITCTPVTKKIN